LFDDANYNILTSGGRLVKLVDVGKADHCRQAPMNAVRKADAPAIPQNVYLIADDLTGALDTAAQFVPLVGEIDVFWRPVQHGGSLALDLGVREASEAEAAASVAIARGAGQDALEYLKLDSLLRGHAAALVAALWSAGRFEQCLIAPAFPAQGRVTRGGRQHFLGDRGWEPAACDLGSALAKRGLAVAYRRAGDQASPGISLWDAETDEDLRAVAAAGRAFGGPTLWCGSGGLAGALTFAGSIGGPPPAADRPLLGLIGSDHSVTRAQLEACGAAAIMLPNGGSASAAKVSQRLGDPGLVLAQIDVPMRASRAEAARLIGREFEELLSRVKQPATLFVGGGETLRSICTVLAADHLTVTGQILAGVPCSVLRGGRFDGVQVISKSGAFGDRELLRRILGLNYP
jgi:D-threonate/D-erythronate kinase